MQKYTLYQFLQRILTCGTQEKARLSLIQFHQVLKLQNADPMILKAVCNAISALPEAMESAEKAPLSEQELQIAVTRANARKQREAAMARMGRC